jgi:peptidoglycan/xylan/chitin deacetylase (PgdA/CDA1 family)
MKNGKFVISLDFELMWGVRDKRSIEAYGDNIRAVHEVVPRLLNSFNEYDVNATFSTVGFLFFRNKEELENNLPISIPSYDDPNLSPYNGYFETLEKGNYKYHFAPDLIELINQSPQHEIGSHTFSHYYCLEPDQTLDSFKEDLNQAIMVADRKGIEITSLVFPRNQFNDNYLKCCLESGIICYRGNEHSWLYEAKNGISETKFRRAFRLIDSYLNISGHNCYSDEYLLSKMPMDIPSSRFLRPYSSKLKIFEFLRLKRIKDSMTYAAKNNLVYHLWWHPHNFGANMNENFRFLEQILSHYQSLNKSYNFQSYTMSNLAKNIIHEAQESSYTSRERVIN